MKSKLSPEEEARIDQVPTKNLEAYTLYKQGKEKYYQYSEDGFKESIEYYKRALDVDPMFALAYSGLGDSYGQLYSITIDTAYRDLGFSAAEKSLKIDENLAEGYKALGLIFHYDGDSNNSLKFNLKTIQLKPGFTDAISNVGQRYRQKGDLSEAIEWFKKSYKMDPYNRRTINNYANTYNLIGEDKIAEDLFLEGILKYNDSFESLSSLVFFHLDNSRSNKAKYYLDELLRLRPNDNRAMTVAFNYYFIIKDFDNSKKYGLKINNLYPGDKINLAYIERLLGNNTKADSYLNQTKIQLENWVNENDSSAGIRYNLSKIYIMDGDFDKTFELLNDMVSMGGLNYKRLMVVPHFDSIKNDPLYFKLIDRIKTTIDRERIEAGLAS